MTTLPGVLPGQRVAAIHPDAFDDLLDGYLHVLGNLDEQWHVGLISATSTRFEDLARAALHTAAGADILRLESCHLLSLARRHSTAQRWHGVSLTAGSGTRYFVTVAAVDDVGRIDTDDDRD